MYLIQYFACVVEAIEKRTRPSLLPRRKKAMLACNVPRMSRKTIGTKHLAAYRSDEFSVFSIIAKPKQAENPALSFFARRYCSCHELLSRLIARLSRQGR